MFGGHTACYTQASNPLDMTNLCFLQWSDVFFSTKLMRHKSTSVLLTKYISNTPPSVSDPMFFLLPCDIASKLYWLSVFCYRYETSNSVCCLEWLPDILPPNSYFFVKSTIDVLSALTFSPISTHSFCIQFNALISTKTLRDLRMNSIHLFKVEQTLWSLAALSIDLKDV
jgi:hypothetical protein